MIFQLIYTCALSKETSGTDLDSIAECSRRRNEKYGITGILLCKDGSVLQVLEGERSAVMSLYNKIAADDRVSNVIVLIQRVTTKREFPKWSMGYKNADTSSAQSDTVFELSAQSFPKALPDNPSPEVGTFGRTFARVTGLA